MTVTEIQDFIDEDINPALAMHDGTSIDSRGYRR